MSYLDEAGLARYDGLLKDFALRTGADYSLLNWQKTSAAGAVSFLPVPEMPLDPVVNFSFTETGPAEGTKGPDNPSTITGVTQAKVTRCGKNLIKLPFFSYGTSYVINGVTFTLDQTAGTITANGTATADSRLYFVGSTSHIRLSIGKTYFFSGCPVGGSVSTYHMGASRYTSDNVYISSLPTDTGSGVVWTTDVDCEFVSSVVIKSGTTVSNLVFRPQLELGSAATSFEPYAGTDYTIDLNGTFYGGSVDLSTGTMTVTHQRLVYDGTEDIRYGNTYYYFMAYSPQIKNRAAFTTTHFIATATGGIAGMAAFMGTSGVRFGWTTEASAAWATEEDLKAWLAAQYVAGTPLTVVYELAEPYTVQLTPQQIYSLSQPDSYAPRTNTVYSDQQSVQVGYPKSPQATATELTNAIISLGGEI